RSVGAPRPALHARRSDAVAAARADRRASPRAAVHARPAPPRCGQADAARGRLDHRVSKRDLDATLAMHDELLARRSVEVWVGAEPTFTRADSTEPAWTNAAEGDDKLARAHALATHLANRLPGASVSRVLGRQYP